jgi:hypothetical protein
VTRRSLADADCERIHDGLIGQPVNTLSSLAYVGAGAALVARARWAEPPARARLLAYGAATAANGLGGVAYHGPGGSLGRWLHDAALLATLGLVAVTDVEDVAGRSQQQPAALAAVAGGAVAALWPAVSAPAQVVVAASAVVAEAARHGRRRPAGPGGRGLAGRRVLPLVATGALAAEVYAASRSGRPLCRPDSVIQGHAVWHALTALMLWWWGEIALAPEPAGRSGPTAHADRGSP